MFEKKIRCVITEVDEMCQMYNGHNSDSVCIQNKSKILHKTLGRSHRYTHYLDGEHVICWNNANKLRQIFA